MLESRRSKNSRKVLLLMTIWRRKKRTRWRKNDYKLDIGIDLNSFFLPLGLSQVFGQRPFKWGVQLPKVSIPVEIMPENQSAARIFHWQSNWFAEASIVQSRQSRGAVQHWRHRKNRRLREVPWIFKEGSYLASMTLVFFEAFYIF